MFSHELDLVSGAVPFSLEFVWPCTQYKHIDPIYCSIGQNCHEELKLGACKHAHF